MKDAGFISLVRQLLRCKTRNEADVLRSNVGATYSELFDQLVARISFNRTRDQNHLYWKWMTEIGRHTGETKDEVARRCKLTHGCKILCRDNEQFLAFCQKCLKQLPYEEMLEAMDYIDVSSVMTTKQMTEYLNEIEVTYRSKGVVLTIPEAA